MLVWCGTLCADLNFDTFVGKEGLELADEVPPQSFEPRHGPAHELAHL